ncbi:hypothetical protein SYNPS1DRAFT_25263 [Syncephalis pseudoplumigaleata]|uniref:Uncharacterized protein n=1 Tax=Syncephalis pseudoplumigaleata TaxID=1712513 RepID=A0A4P9YTX3_9FUNG|nr:hypothetical protein SYNPS1DRAFT_25263 [Syncephalis pseudoplumigaleata]|eukprot:RKP22832.1 hypothetical protein SYNPS1DRAFT_25263 [Syncephalis pseudoplumigaleata]
MLEAMPKTEMQQMLAAWNDQICDRLVMLVADVLAEINNASALAQTRVDILRWMDAPGEFVPWEQMRAFMSGNAMSLWDDICRERFKDRFEAIARDMFAGVADQPDTFVEPLLKQLEHDKYAGE